MTNTETTDLVRYVAEVNVPGYLPTSDEPVVFETAEAAWAWLCDARELDEEHEESEDWSATRGVLALLATESASLPTPAGTGVSVMVGPDRCGTVYGPTPGVDPAHDLGLAYSVTEDDSLVPLAESAVRGYVTTMLWANAVCDAEDCEDRGRGTDCEHSHDAADNYGIEDLSIKDQASMTNDVCDLIASNEDDFREYVVRMGRYGGRDYPLRGASTFGHDFALTRNGHGAGFWDRGLGDLGDRLATAAKVYGESSVYVNDYGVTLS
jgi:hypothetical protein